MPATTGTLNNILNYNYGSQAYSTPAFPATYYVGLSTTVIGLTGMATVTEPATADGYARVSYTNNTSNWTTSATGSLSNKVAISFAESTDAWGTILSLFLSESGTRAAGSVCFYYNLTTGSSAPNHTIFRIDIGDFIITMV